MIILFLLNFFNQIATAHPAAEQQGMSRAVAFLFDLIQKKLAL